VAQFAVVWWLTDMTGSAVVLACASLVAMLPQVLLGPFIGALVDRLDRRKVMMIADSLVALFGLVLALLFWARRVQIWHVYVIMAARSLGGAFHWPAMQASTTQLVPEEHLPRISGLNQALQGASQIMSPPLGALLLTVLPLHGMMMIDVITAIMAVTPLFFVHIPQLKTQPAQAAASAVASPARALWDDTREGLAYIWNWKGLRQIVLIAAGLNFLYDPAFTLMPLLVREHFQRGALELGYMQAAWGAGIAVGGLLLVTLGGGKHHIRTALLALAGQGLFIMMVPASSPRLLLMAVGGLSAAGVLNAITNGLFLSFMQSRVDPSKQGRVFTALTSFCGAMMPLGMVLAGPVSEALGIRAWFFAAAACTLTIALLALLSPAIMAIDHEDVPRVPQMEGSADDQSGSGVNPQREKLVSAHAE